MDTHTYEIHTQEFMAITTDGSNKTAGFFIMPRKAGKEITWAALGYHSHVTLTTETAHNIITA